MTAVADIAVVGLGVMGRNLAANLADHGFTVAGFDLDAGRLAAFAAADEAGLAMVFTGMRHFRH